VCLVGQENLPPKPFGSPFPIDCDTKGVDVDRWTLDGENITETVAGIDPRSITSPTLQIVSMSLLLEGQYKCFGANSNDPLDIINVFVIGKRYSVL